MMMMIIEPASKKMDLLFHWNNFLINASNNPDRTTAYAKCKRNACHGSNNIKMKTIYIYTPLLSSKTFLILTCG
jgi:hypothetical protein